jgi:hypothetical protein
MCDSYYWLNVGVGKQRFLSEIGEPLHHRGLKSFSFTQCYGNNSQAALATQAQSLHQLKWRGKSIPVHSEKLRVALMRIQVGDLETRSLPAFSTRYHSSVCFFIVVCMFDNVGMVILYHIDDIAIQHNAKGPHAYLRCCPQFQDLIGELVHLENQFPHAIGQGAGTERRALQPGGGQERAVAV